MHIEIDIDHIDERFVEMLAREAVAFETIAKGRPDDSNLVAMIEHKEKELSVLRDELKAREADRSFNESRADALRKIVTSVCEAKSWDEPEVSEPKFRDTSEFQPIPEPNLDDTLGIVVGRGRDVPGTNGPGFTSGPYPVLSPEALQEAPDAARAPVPEEVEDAGRDDDEDPPAAPPATSAAEIRARVSGFTRGLFTFGAVWAVCPRPLTLLRAYLRSQHPGGHVRPVLT